MTSRTPSPTRRLPATATFLTGLVLATSACTSGQTSPSAAPDPSASASASTSPVVSSTATATPSYKAADAKGKAQNVPVPELPEVAKKKTKEGLEAFARYWFQLLSYGYETGDTTRLLSVTANSCEFCSNISKALDVNYRDDKWLAGGRIQAPSISANFEPDAGGTYQTIVQVKQSEISYYRTGGSRFRPATPPSDTGNVMLAAFRNGAWLVTALHPIR